jgi:hypothetical protein
MGNFGGIFKSSNGGANWNLSTLGTTSASIRSVSFADASKGWLVGTSGAIYHTTNGGDFWNEQNSGVSTQLNGVYFVNSSKGYAVGNEGVILVTTNGGTTWTEQSSGTAEDLYSIVFTDADNGWIVGSNGTILHTSNGGNPTSTLTAKEMGIQFYPNPVSRTSDINVEYTNNSALDISLLNHLGTVVYKSSEFNTKSERIDLNNLDLTPGVYLLRIADGEKQMTSKVLVY